MKKIKTIAAALDLTGMDEGLIRCAGYFSKLFGADQVNFIHIVPEFVFTEIAQTNIHSIFSPTFRMDEKVVEKIKAGINQHFDRKGHAVRNVLIEEGVPFQTLVEKVNEMEADLLIVGRKQISEGSGIVPKLVARKVRSAVCFVPENFDTDFRNILVPTDFSANSLRALKTAVTIGGHGKETNITALHIMDYPPTAHYLTRNYGLLAPDWENRVHKVFDEFISKNGMQEYGVQFAAKKNDKFNAAQEIKDYTVEHKTDLIVTGAKGHSAFEDLFLGSLTEKLVSLIDDIPVLVVR